MVQFENMQTLFLEKQSWNVPAVKLFSKTKFNVFRVFVDVFLFQPLIKGKYLSI
jgi:hypothetical protein